MRFNAFLISILSYLKKIFVFNSSPIVVGTVGSLFFIFELTSKDFFDNCYLDKTQIMNPRINSIPNRETGPIIPYNYIDYSFPIGQKNGYKKTKPC